MKEGNSGWGIEVYSEYNWLYRPVYKVITSDIISKVSGIIVDCYHRHLVEPTSSYIIDYTESGFNSLCKIISLIIENYEESKISWNLYYEYCTDLLHHVKKYREEYSIFGINIAPSPRTYTEPDLLYMYYIGREVLQFPIP